MLKQSKKTKIAGGILKNFQAGNIFGLAISDSYDINIKCGCGRARQEGSRRAAKHAADA